jgi:DNA gyrase/topoisomerase IV subunit A
MLEGILMITVLTGMGVYFIKSADLPKELKERQAILDRESKTTGIRQSKMKFNLEKKEVKKVANVKLEQKIEKKIDLDAINREIDEVTFKVTSLEQEIRDNNLRNELIKKEIDRLLVRLEELTKLKMA